MCGGAFAFFVLTIAAIIVQSLYKIVWKLSLFPINSLPFSTNSEFRYQRNLKVGILKNPRCKIMFNKFIDDKGKTCQADARNAQLPGANMFHANRKRKNEQGRVISEKARSLEAWDCFSWFFARRRSSKLEKIKRTKRLTRKKLKRRRKVSFSLFFSLKYSKQRGKTAGKEGK